MKERHLIKRAILFAGVSMLPAAHAHAQAANSADTEAQGSDIIVTAQKRSESLSTVPISVTALSGEQLASRGVSNVQDLVKFTPGLSYIETGYSVPVFSLRGVGFFDSSFGARPSVSVYLDEAPLPFALMSTAGALDLERVEVLKGPQGTLFGSNATGGAINYIAAKPTATLRAGAQASYSSYGLFEAEGHVSGPITSDVLARFSIKGRTGGAYQRSATRSDELGTRRFLQGRLLLDWNASDRFKVALNLNGFLDRSDTQAPQLIGFLLQSAANSFRIPNLLAAPLASPDVRSADWDPGIQFRRDNRFFQATARATFDVSDAVSLTSLTSYSHMDIAQGNELDGSSVFSTRSTATGELSSFSEEVRLAGDHTGFRWIVGASYSHDNTDEYDKSYAGEATYRYLTLPFGQYTASFFTTKQKFDTYAAFVNADYDISDRIFVQGGVRYTRSDLSYSGCGIPGDTGSATALGGLIGFLRTRAGLAPLVTPVTVGQCYSIDASLTPALSTGALNENNVSWRAGISWKPIERTLIYANVSKGFKAGSAPAVASFSAAQISPVTQESVLAYEVGFKSSLIDRLLNVTGAAFYYDYRDKQLKGRILTTPNVFGAIDGLVNIPKSYIVGLEAQVSLFPVRGLSLSLAGTYLKSKVTSDFTNFTVTAERANFRGNAFPYTPEYQLVADGEYRFPLSAGTTAVIGANANYRSSTTSGFGNVPALGIGAYTLVDVRAGLQLESGVKVTAFVQNVGNTYYWVNATKFADTLRRYAGTPRSFGVRLGYDF